MTIKTVAYQCEICGDLKNRQDWAEEHEAQCRKNKMAADDAYEAYRREEDEARQRAVDLAKKSKPLRLLVNGGFVEEAREIAAQIYDSEIMVDFNCSSWLESTYDAMLAAAKEELHA